MRILILALGLFLVGYSGDASAEKATSEVQESESKSEDFDNVIQEVVVTFSSLSATDGEWDSGADESVNTNANLKVVENDQLLYCYDTQSLLKMEVFGNIYKATIEYVEGSEKTLIAKDKDIVGSQVIFSDKLGQHGKLIIKSQDTTLKEITIEAEGCL